MMDRSSDNDKRKWNTKKDQDAASQMITPKSLSLSLTPPRVPPFGTMQRSLYHAVLIDEGVVAAKPLSSHQQRYHVRKVKASEPGSFSKTSTNSALQQKLRKQFQLHKHRGRNGVHQVHPHLLERSADTITRSVGRFWPVHHQNWFRDSGSFRWLADSLVTITGVPAVALSTKPQHCIIPFWRLSRMFQKIPYGPHRLQYIHLYPTQHQERSRSIPCSRRLIVFVHGGAWGSGHPWMYRLIAAPFIFSSQNQYSVAVVGYRTYPDGSTAAEQVADVSAALHLLLTSQYSDLYDKSNITVMGHSSGAHIALLMVVDCIAAELSLIDRRHTCRSLQKMDRNLEEPVRVRLPFDSFCGISGPYDISHHFDYEASRGVEELSPMKPVNGFTRLAFQQNSPAQRLQNALKSLSSSAEEALNQVCPHIALIHGVEDDTVPFTSTSEAARLFRSFGLTRVQEVYIPSTGHQEAVVQSMLGGKVSEEVIGWIERNFDFPSSSNILVVSKRLAVRSRL
jgi:pimeloyl-ACP methyl ester carboxylesterase